MLKTRVSSWASWKLLQGLFFIYASDIFVLNRLVRVSSKSKPDSGCGMGLQEGSTSLGYEI